MGITRDHMPQIMDKSVKELLASKKEGDRKKGQAAVDAGANHDEDRSVMAVLMDDLKSEGVKISKTKVPVGKLRATQREIKADKTYGMANAYLEGNEGLLKAMENPIIISSDNHILDGHHRYSAMLTADPTYEMNVIKVDMPMKKFLTRSHEQAGVFRADINDNIIDDSKPVDLGDGPKKIKRRSKKAMADSVARWFIAGRGNQVVRKDKDLMSDTGGISKGRDREPEMKPPRDDKKKRYKEKRLNKDTKKDREKDDREVTKTNRRQSSVHPLDRTEQGAWAGLELPEQNYHRQVYSALWGILENERGISEKDFAGQDEIRDMCERIIRDAGVNDIIIRFLDHRCRAQYCAENIYDQISRK
jgi:hypothetical protein